MPTRIPFLIGLALVFTLMTSLAGPTRADAIATDALTEDKKLSLIGRPSVSRKPPKVTNETPAAGKRVRITAPGAGYERNSKVYHTLYLPPEWVPNGKYPVIVEFAPNKSGPFSGMPEDTHLGFYQSGGTGFIWASMPNIRENSTPDDKSDDTISPNWWGGKTTKSGQADDASYTIAAIIDIIENYGGDHASVFATGFSRGAVACGSLGRLDDAMADIWIGFLPHSHDDAWFDKGKRTDRIRDRASFITYGELDGGRTNSKNGVDMLKERGFPVESYEIAGTIHTDEWIIDASTPAASSSSYTGNPLVADVRSQLRTWMSEVMTRKPGTHRIRGMARDANGAPIVGARVQSGLTHWTFTDARGEYELTGLISGERKLTISHPSHEWNPSSIEITLNGADLTEQKFTACPTVPTKSEETLHGE